MFLNCTYNGADHALTVSRSEGQQAPLERCHLKHYTDQDGWRCFRSHDGTVLRMRYDLADPTISCAPVGELMGTAAMGVARATLDGVRNLPGTSRSHSRQVS